MHLCREHPETHAPEPLRPENDRRENSQQRTSATERVAAAKYLDAAPYCSPVSHSRPHQAEPRTTPFRIGRARNPGAGIKA